MPISPNCISNPSLHIDYVYFDVKVCYNHNFFNWQSLNYFQADNYKRRTKPADATLFSGCHSWAGLSATLKMHLQFTFNKRRTGVSHQRLINRLPGNPWCGQNQLNHHQMVPTAVDPMSYQSQLLMTLWPTKVNCWWPYDLPKSTADDLMTYQSQLLMTLWPTKVNCWWPYDLPKSTADDLMTYQSQLLMTLWPTKVNCWWPYDLPKSTAGTSNIYLLSLHCHV